jgi:hypothetical protein
MATRDKGKFMTMRRILLTATLATFAVGVASATPIIQTMTVAATATPFNDSLLFNGFNTMGGTLQLTGVEITLATTATAEIDVGNFSGQTQAFTSATASIPVSASLVTTATSTTASETVTAGPIAGTIGSAFADYAFPGNSATASSTDTVGSGLFSEFIGGTNAVDINVVGNIGSYAGTAGTGTNFGGSAVVGALVTVEYDYTTVSSTPEPTTMLLFGSALVGLGVMRKRKKA